jgi:hypothetical protein
MVIGNQDKRGKHREDYGVGRVEAYFHPKFFEGFASCGVSPLEIPTGGFQQYFKPLV